MEIIQQRETTHIIIHERVFDYEGERDWGCRFDSDEHGNVDLDKLASAGRANYEACLTGTLNDHKVIDRGVNSYEQHDTEPAVGKCECGEEVYLTSFTNTCECGADYNMSGQRLAPREQWGAETGEHWTECV